jgi:ATP adenylyltransferase
MKHIWSPWRMAYMQGPKRENGCVFCKELSESDGPENLIVYRGHRAFIILNRFPYNSGHLMVVPYEHTATLEGLDAETRSEIMELANLSTKVLHQVYHPQGFNLGVNIGDAAGAGILKHVHLHVLPRWNGDTNFISTLGDTRVLPESLEETYRKVKEGLEKSI